MKRRELILMVAAIVLIAVAGGALKYFKSNQHLGAAGLKTTPIPDSLRLNIQLPTNAPGYEAHAIEINKRVLDTLPADTSIAQMVYKDAAGRETMAVAVTMGTDRTSIHKPQYCLSGQGWSVNSARSEKTMVHLDRPHPLELPVIKLEASREMEAGGQRTKWSCVFVYWLVSADEVVVDHSQLVWRMTRHVLETGELQRWSYVYFMAICPPGQEDAAFAQVCRTMNATVPDFQLVWPAADRAKAAN